MPPTAVDESKPRPVQVPQSPEAPNPNESSFDIGISVLQIWETVSTFPAKFEEWADRWDPNAEVKDVLKKASEHRLLYEETCDTLQLDTAIGCLRGAKKAYSQTPLRRTIKNSLADCLLDRYRWLSDQSELHEAYELYLQLLGGTTVRKPDSMQHMTLAGLAMCFQYLYWTSGDEEYLYHAFNTYQDLRNYYLERHPSYPLVLNNFGKCLHDRYLIEKNPALLDSAISVTKYSLQYLGAHHPNRPDALSNLASCMYDSYKETKDTRDLDAAIPHYRAALSLYPKGHPQRSSTLTYLALSMAATKRYPRDDITTLLKEAVLPSLAPTSSCILAATSWRELARGWGPKAELDAAIVTLELLDQAVTESATLEGLSVRLSRDRRFHQVQGIASDAAALAIQVGRVNLAVELLESGRSSILNHLGEYRPAMDDVRRASDRLASQLTVISAELERLVLSTENVATDCTAAGHTRRGKYRPYEALQSRSARHTNLRTQYDDTVAKIRMLPGLETFLQRPLFNQLQRAAECGPVIIVNINERRSDAIIVLSSGDPVLVPLPEANPRCAQQILDHFGEQPADLTKRAAIPILRRIWEYIVGPVVERLRSAPIQLQDMTRIWWCPVGVASKLPLHAAGLYKTADTGSTLPRLFVSSYTPTLEALIRARQPSKVSTAGLAADSRMLVVGQGDTPGQRPLPNVPAELQAIRKWARGASFLESSGATKQVTLREIRQHPWLHLACHGVPDALQPFNSHFSLYDGPVSLLDLVQTDLPHAELAVLSACHSARGSDYLPDESLHLAAGMMFAGYKSVIGTMWAVKDELGSPLADEFYRIMLEGRKDHTQSAASLGQAFREVAAKDKKVDWFMHKVNVVHYGA